MRTRLSEAAKDLPEDEIHVEMKEWRCKINKAVLQERPQSKAVFQEIFNNPSHLVFACALNRVSCDVSDHADREIWKHLNYQEQKFKIGVAASPKLRFFGKPSGYYHEGYRYMVVLAYGNAYAMGMLETHLIQRYKQTSGCMNVARGGQGLKEFSDHYPYFAYVVLHTLRGQ